MISLKFIQKFLVLLSFAFLTQAEENVFIWSYDNIDQWGINSSNCDGHQQSPVHLKSENSSYSPLPPLIFENYDIPLQGPLKIVNNGYSVNMEIPPTTNGQRPAITGGKLLSHYEAVSVHFHWGSPNEKGSEHIIDSRRYDVELHIVHYNVQYGTFDEAILHADGLAVLGIMLNIVDNPDRFYPGLNKIFNKLPQIIEYNSEARINGQLSLGQLLGDVNTEKFFTYKGSLTTPPCLEVVTWQVFPDPLPIAASQIYKFFNLIDQDGKHLWSTYRPIQPLQGRKIIFRTKNFISDLPMSETIKIF